MPGVKRARPLVELTLVLLAAGCVAPTATKTESELLPRPGSRIELRDVTNESGKRFEVDAPGMLREAMQESLREEELAWTPGAAGERFALSLAIREYRPGNAFKRWLAPGYGSTVLGVEGMLRVSSGGSDLGVADGRALGPRTRRLPRRARREASRRRRLESHAALKSRRCDLISE
jgi:hypothetical protein